MVVQYAVLEAMTSVYEKMENSSRPPPVNTKWLKIFKRRPEYMITSRSWVVVQNPSKIGAPNFDGGIGEVWVFFTRTHTVNQSISQTNSFTSPTDNNYNSKRAVSRPDVPFRDIVDDKSCLRVQISPKPNFRGPNGTFKHKQPKNSKPYNLKTTASIMT